MPKDYDLIVIGAGSGGFGAALGMLELGFKVLLIDKKAENIGGECLNTGCVPSKALIHVAKEIYSARKASRFGMEAGGKTNIEKVKKYIRDKQNVIREHENVSYLRDKGLNVKLGTASFNSEKEIQVNDEVYTFKNAVIATGSSPRMIATQGAESFPVFTNESIFNISFLPEHFIFIGAGPVSIELGQAFSRMGSKVTIIDHGERILKKEDPEISSILKDRLQEEGIEFYFHSELSEIRDGSTAILKDKSGKVTEIKADALFMGIGRELHFDSLQLKNAGIETKDGKIVLNEKLQTTNNRVYVSGDAADAMKFSHAAEMHNTLIISNLLSPFSKKLNLDHFPWVTYTEPEVATFGLNEKSLNARNISFEKLETSFSEADRAVTDDHEYGKLILYIEKKWFYPGNAKILGGSMIAPKAGEIIQELILANVTGIRLKDFTKKIYPYPSAANIHKITARNRILKSIRPWMKKLIEKWYRIKE